MKRANWITLVVAGAVAAFVANAAAYDVKPGRGGKVTGKVVYKGDMAKANPKIKPDKDTDMCGEHVDEDFKVGEGGGLANAVVYIQKIDAGKDWPADMKRPVIDQVKCVYRGNVTFVMVGGEAVFKNSDTKLHNIKATSANYTFNEGVEAGKELVKKMEKADEVKLACSVHPWMSASLWVVKHPYYAATNEKGEFTLDDVPAGKYTLMCKHAKLGKPSKAKVEVTLTEGGAVSQDFDFTKAPD